MLHGKYFIVALLLRVIRPICSPVNALYFSRNAVADDELAAKLDAARVEMAEQIAEKEAKLQAEING